MSNGAMDAGASARTTQNPLWVHVIREDVASFVNSAYLLPADVASNTVSIWTNQITSVIAAANLEPLSPDPFQLHQAVAALRFLANSPSADEVPWVRSMEAELASAQSLHPLPILLFRLAPDACIKMIDTLVSVISKPNRFVCAP